MMRQRIQNRDTSMPKRLLRAACWVWIVLSAIGWPAKTAVAEETLLLSVRLNSRIIADVIEGIEREGEVFVNVSEIAKLLESELPENAGDQARVGELAAFFPARFEFLPRSQALLIEGRGRLPIEQRWERGAAAQIPDRRTRWDPARSAAGIQAVQPACGGCLRQLRKKRR